MSKLVDQERLTKLAKALDARAKAAVDAEKERAMAAEQAIDAKAVANAAAIAAINNAETGLLKQAKDHAQGLVDGEKSRAEEQEGLLGGRIKKLEDIVGTTGEQGALGKVIANVAENTTAIATLKGDANTAGSVAKAVADAVKVEKERAEAAEQGLSQKIAANEAFVKAQPAKDKAQDDRLKFLEEMMGLGGGTGDKTAIEELQESITSLKTELQAEIDSDVLVETNRAVAKENELNTAIKANAAEMTKQKDAAQAGTLAHNIAANTTAIAQEAADRAAAVSGEAKARENADKALAAKLDVIQGADTVEGSIAKAEKDAKDYADELIAGVNTAAGNLAARVKANEDKLAVVQGEGAGSIAKAEADAKAYADEKIAALVDSAPDAMNTLNELAEAISANKGVYDAYVEQHATAMATMKSDLQKEIDKDVKVEKDRAVAEEAKIREEMTTEAARVNKKIADDIAAESALRVAAETKIANDYKAADTALETKLNGKIATDIKAEADRAKAEEADLLAKINKEASDRATAVSGVQGEVNAVETALANEKDASKDGSLAKKIADEAARAKAEEADIRADFAQADADLHATIKNEMAQVVASLNVKIVDNKLQIGLGQGVSFVTLNQFELEMVTDEEIDAIIAGLDK